MHRRRNTLPKAVLDRVLDINGKQTTLRDFLRVNLYTHNIVAISAMEARLVIDLEPGESTKINTLEIKRIS